VTVIFGILDVCGGRQCLEAFHTEHAQHLKYNYCMALQQNISYIFRVLVLG